MAEIELSAGTIEYEDTGGDGPVIVLLHGLLMNSSLWAAVLDDLSTDFRCIAPTLPMGAHSQPMHADADLSLPGIARLVAEFLDRLDLHDVTFVGNDTGGALVQLLACDASPRLGRIVLASCEAVDNFPARVTGTTLALTGKLPPALFGLFMQQMRLRPVRRLPVAFGWLTKRGDAATARWMKPVLQESEIRRDAVRMLRAMARQPDVLVEAARSLPRFERPALVVWASEDRVMPPEHGRRLAELVPDARLVEIADSYTLLPLDQPAEFGRAIREFVLASVLEVPATVVSRGETSELDLLTALGRTAAGDRLTNRATLRIEPTELLTLAPDVELILGGSSPVHDPAKMIARGQPQHGFQVFPPGA